jgi:CRISPR-associated protein Cas6
MGGTATAEVTLDPTAHEGEVLDLAFKVRGSPLPVDHRHSLRAAIARALPWFEDEATAAIHPLKSAHADDGATLLSARSRLLLRVPAWRQRAAGQLGGQVLALHSGTLDIGTSIVRPLLGHGTLYAHLVTGNADDELAFAAAMRDELELLGIRGEVICGRRQSIGGGDRQLRGFSVMVHGLTRESSLLLQARGTGGDMKLGCGVFVPHRSAAAVGS